MLQKISSSSPLQNLSLLKSYSSEGLMREARNVFTAMPKRTPVAWTVLMSGYARFGPCINVLSLLRDMMICGVHIDPFVISVALKACASVGVLAHGSEVHCAAVKLGYVEDLFVANALVSMYSGCGSVAYADTVFKRIEDPDLVSWTSMLYGLVKNGYRTEASRLFVAMAHAGIQFDAHILSIGLLEFGFSSEIHCHMIKTGLCSCVFLMNSLLKFYGANGELVLMRKLFDEMSQKNLVSWNTVISCHAKSNSKERAVTYFRAVMHEHSSYCDEFTLGSVLQAVTLNQCKEIHAYMIRANFVLNSYVTSSLLDMYIELAGFSTTLPIKLFIHFHSLGGEIDEFIAASIIKSCALSTDLDTGKMLHSLVTKTQLNHDTFIVSALIDMYAKCRTLKSSIRVFAAINNPKTVPWSAIIAAHCHNEKYAEALSLFRQMQLSQVRANEFTYTSAIVASINAAEIHCSALRRGYGDNVAVINSLMNHYARYGHLRNAVNLAISVSNDQINWGSLIPAFAKEHDLVLDFFKKIQQTNSSLDSVSVHYILNSCRYHSGIQAHAYIIKKGLVSNDTNNALIEMYSKCGHFEDAVNVFELMTEKDSASWTAAIAAHVSAGRVNGAMRQFERMFRKGIKPDTDTFGYMITACGKMGLIDEVFRIFVRMVEVYKLEPSREIYAAMAEALGMAGMRDEAAHFLASVVSKS